LGQIPHEVPLQWAPRVADTLAKDPNFIKVEFHIGRFITAAVDNEKERAITEALKGNLESASQQININVLLSILYYCSIVNSNSPLHPVTHQAVSIEGSIHKGCPQEANEDTNP
jgi:hypothetical protein